MIFENGVAGAEPPTGTRGGSPTLSPGTDAGRVCPKALHDAEPTKHTQPFPWKGVFGKDAEIRTRRALHEAKPSECPKGDRDSELEVCFKNRLFLQAKLCLFQAQFLFFAEKLLTIVRNRIIISLSPISDLTICRQGESAWIIKTTGKNCMNIIMY